MSETVRIWLEELYKKELEEVKQAIKNEHIWELGCNESFNPHTESIITLKEYIKVLESKLGELSERD